MSGLSQLGLVIWYRARYRPRRQAQHWYRARRRVNYLAANRPPLVSTG